MRPQAQPMSWVLEDPFYSVNCMMYVARCIRMLCTGWWRASRGRCVVREGASAARARDRRGGGGRSRHDALTAGPSEQPTLRLSNSPTIPLRLRLRLRLPTGPDRTESPPVCPPGSALAPACGGTAMATRPCARCSGAVCRCTSGMVALHCTALHCTALHCSAVSGRSSARLGSLPMARRSSLSGVRPSACATNSSMR